MPALKLSPDIPSPYNFVPLSNKVVFPEWSSLASMDVPFEDGICGTLDIEVTAKSPIYVRNGDKNDTSFFKLPDGKFAIPGTSFKGMIRNVIEIMTFGKIAGSGRVSNHRYAVRNLNNRELYAKYFTGNNTARTFKVKGAWLKADDNNGWTLRICRFARVEQEQLERHFRIRTGELGRKTERGKVKHEMLADKNLTVYFRCNNRGIVQELRNQPTGNLLKGTVVVTGQPSPRTENGGRRIPNRKHLEFVFYEEKNPITIKVPEEIRKDFEFIHSELGQNREPNTEWKYWKPKLLNGEEIPVFVLSNNDDGRLQNPDDIRAIGLAMMMRLPYLKDIYDAIRTTSPDHLDDTKLDFAETLFGTVNQNTALRGRVNVGTLVADTATPLREVHTILGAPKPTYYPNYVKQTDGADKYNTFMDEDSEISGWKRYYVRGDNTVQPIPAEQNQERVSTRFVPLSPGTVFKGKIYVHNVKPEELGALVWALTWGGNQNCRHLIGMGKPYGFGSITVRIARAVLKANDPNPPQKDPKQPEIEKCMEFIEYCKGKFIDWINTKLDDTWERTDQIVNLVELAKVNHADRQHSLRYPRLTPDNEFKNFEKNGNFLKRAAQEVKANVPGGANANQNKNTRLPGNTVNSFQDWFNQDGKYLPQESQDQIVNRLEQLKQNPPAYEKAKQMVKNTIRKRDMCQQLLNYIYPNEEKK